VADAVEFFNQRQPGIRMGWLGGNALRLKIRARHSAFSIARGEFARFAAARPPPPITLFSGQTRIAGLGDGTAKGIENARVLASASFGAEPAVKIVAIAQSEFGDGGHAERAQIGFDGFTNAGEIAQLACGGSAKERRGHDHDYTADDRRVCRSNFSSREESTRF